MGKVRLPRLWLQAQDPPTAVFSAFRGGESSPGRRYRQADPELGAAIGTVAREADRAAMQFDELPRNREAHAQTALHTVAAGCALPERLEHERLALGRDAGADFARSRTGRERHFQAQRPRVWTSERIAPPVGPNRTFDLHPDGTRFAVGSPPDSAAQGARHVVLGFGFFDELSRTVPTSTQSAIGTLRR